MNVAKFYDDGENKTHVAARRRGEIVYVGKATVVYEPPDHESTYAVSNGPWPPSANGAGCVAGVVNVQVRHGQLGDIGVGNVLLFAFLRRQATPVSEPVVGHPQPAACVRDKLAPRHETGFVRVMGATPFGAERRARNHFVDQLGVKKQRGEIGIRLNQLALPAVAGGQTARLQGEFGGVTVALQPKSGLQGELSTLKFDFALFQRCGFRQGGRDKRQLH